jgi:hypothetical protein
MDINKPACVWLMPKSFIIDGIKGGIDWMMKAIVATM